MCQHPASKVWCHGRVTAVTYTVTEHGAMEGADGNFLTDETSLHFGFCLIKGGVLLAIEVLQAQRGKFPHPETLPF